MGCGGIGKVHDVVDVNEKEIDEEVLPSVGRDGAEGSESTVVQQTIMPITINIVNSQVAIVGASASLSRMVLNGGLVLNEPIPQQEEIPDVSFAAAEEAAVARQVCRGSVDLVTSGISSMKLDDRLDGKVLIEYSSSNIPKELIEVEKDKSTDIGIDDNKFKPLTPLGYPFPLDLEHPWNYEQSLHYSSEWQDKGGYKLLPLQAEQRDFEFINNLFAKSVSELGDDYEINDIVLLSDDGDEQAFVAELDLLEKKHGNGVHQAKWKPKNQTPEQHESPEVVISRKSIRAQLKSLRYRSQYVPHVKLLPLWHGTTIKKIASLQGASFSDLSYANEGAIGKGYYGNDNAITAYNEALIQYKDEQIILILSWYAGKTVYPVIEKDELKGQPHFANHDLHYSATKQGHTTVVFDHGQILPRYLVSIKKRGTVNSGIKEQLQTIEYTNPHERPLLFQTNFTHITAIIAKKRFEIIQAWLETSSPLTTNGLASCNECDYYQKIMTDFLKDQTKEVLLLKADDNDDSELLSRFLEMSLWDNYEEGKPVPLHLELSKFSNLEKGNLIEQNLTSCGVTIPQAIDDLKNKRKEFTFIISSYEQAKRIPLVKSNHLNRQGGFKGKTIIVVSQNFPNSEDYLFYPDGANEQQSDRFITIISNLPKLSQQEITLKICYIRTKLETNKHKTLLLEESYYVATKLPHQLPPSPGGELRPWEYSNSLQYSSKWQNKGAFRIHPLEPNDPDYDFVKQLYEKSPMLAEYELCLMEELPKKLSTQKEIDVNTIYLQKQEENLKYVFFSAGQMNTEGQLKIKELRLNEKLEDKLSKNNLTQEILKEAKPNILKELFNKGIIVPISDLGIGYELDEVYVISDRGAEQAFVANLNTLERGANKQEHKAEPWLQEDQEFLRTQLRKEAIAQLEQKSYKTILTKSVKLLPLWHGTGPIAAAGIAKSGFASLALVDAGFFGKGLYGSSSAEYSYRVYGKGYNGENGLLILSWYSAQNIFPVIKWDTYPGLKEDKCVVYLTSEIFVSERNQEIATPTIVYDANGNAKQLIISHENPIITKKVLQLSDLQLDEQSLQLLQEFIIYNKGFTEITLEPAHPLLRLHFFGLEKNKLKIYLATEIPQNIQETATPTIVYDVNGNIKQFIISYEESIITKKTIHLSSLQLSEELLLLLQEFNNKSPKVLLEPSHPILKLILEQKHTRTIEDKLFGKPNYKNYDSHFVRVKPEDKVMHKIGTEDCYYPIGETEEQEETYQEFVTFATAQVLPRYILSLRDTKTKKRLTGMQKFLDSPSVVTSTVGLYQMSLEKTIAQLKESAKREQEENFILAQGLELYIPAKACNHDRIDKAVEAEQYLLLDQFNEFIKSSEKELWLIQGNPGSGKSLFGRYLERELWSKYKKGDLIPLFIPLPKLGDLENVQDLIATALELKDIPLYAIKELKIRKKFLFILDGYDEIPGKPKLLQRYKFNLAEGWQGKIIVGFRLQHLTIQEEKLLYPTHEPFVLGAHYIKSHIVPFKTGQISQYIESFSKSKFNEKIYDNWGSEEYQKKIDEFKEIKDFLKEPFLLFLVLRVLPYLSDVQEKKMQIKKIDLYDAFIASWFDSQFARKTIFYSEGMEKYSKKEVLNIFAIYAKNIAYKMFLKETQIISSIENDQTELELGFQGSPLKKIGDNYLFIHKSFQEYFVAKKILDDLTAESGSSLEEKLITDPAILEFITTKITPELQEKLFITIDRSRNSDSVKQVTASANAATILNAAKIFFSGKDLSKTKMRGANLRGAILESTNLEEADLSEANLSETWLHNANLKRSKLINTKFGELPYFKLADDKHKKTRPYFFSFSEEYFATIFGETTVVIYKINFKTNIITEYNTVTAPEQFTIKGVAFNCYLNKLLLILHNENLLLIYNITEESDFKVITPNPVEIPEICSISLSPNNKLLALGKKDGTIHFKEIYYYDDSAINITKDQNLLCKNIAGAIYKLKFNSNFLIAASKFDNQKVKIFYLNFETKLDIQKFSEPLELDDLDLLDLDISPNNKWLALSDKTGKIVLYDRENNNRKYHLMGHKNEVHCIKFNSTNDGLASGSYDKTVRFWSLIDFDSVTILKGHTDYVCGISFSSDGSILLSGSDDQTVRLWDDTTLYKNNTLYNSQLLTDDHVDYVYGVSFSPDGKILASGSRDKTIILRNFESGHNKMGSKKVLISQEDFIFSVAFSHDNQWLVSGSKDGTVKRWKTTECVTQQAQTLYISTDSKSVRSVAFNHNNNWLAWGCGNCVYLYTPNGKFTHNAVPETDNEIYSVAFSQNSLQLAVGSLKGIIFVWNLSSFDDAVPLILKNGHDNCVDTVTFSPDFKWLVSGSWDKKICLWQRETTELTQTLTAHNSEVNVITFSKDSSYLFSGDYGGTIIVWKLQQENLVNEYSINIGSNVFSISINNSVNDDQLVLASGHADYSVRIWKYINKQLILLETTYQNVLCVDQADISGAVIDSNNKELLCQRGAVGEPIVNYNTIEKDSCDERLIEVAELHLQEQAASKLLLFSDNLNQTTPIKTEETADDLSDLTHSRNKLII